MRLAGLLAAFVLSACAFSSDDALFAESDAAAPIAEGARFSWRAPNEAPLEVTFHRDGATYTIIERAHPNEPMTDVLLVAVADTPQDDYIVQWRQEGGQAGRIYAFMWPVGDGYRVYADPDAFEGEADAPRPSEAFCERRAHGECAFRSRSNLLAYYRSIAYPALASGHTIAHSALEVTPIAAPAPPGKTKT